MSIRPPVFKPNKPAAGPEIKYSERLQRVMRAHRDIHFEYRLNTADIRNERLFSIYAQKYPDMVRSKLMTFCRVKIPEANWFELDEKGTLDSEHKVKEALIWSESRKVLNPENPLIPSETFIQSQVLNGVFKKPFITLRKDEWGNPTDQTKISGYRNIFYIEFNEKNVDAVLEQFDGKYRKNGTALAYATLGEAWYEMPTYAVPNLQDWLHEDFDLLVQANKAGTLTEEPGGVRIYLKKEQDRRNKIQKEIEESEKARSGGITPP